MHKAMVSRNRVRFDWGMGSGEWGVGRQGGQGRQVGVGFPHPSPCERAPLPITNSQLPITHSPLPKTRLLCHHQGYQQSDRLENSM